MTRKLIVNKNFNKQNKLETDVKEHFQEVKSI